MANDKQNIIDELIKRGYKAINEQGVITVLCDETKISVSECMANLRKELKDLNYDASYGVRTENGKYKEV